MILSYFPKDEVEPKPGRQGIALCWYELSKLYKATVHLHETVPTQTEAVGFYTEQHTNILRRLPRKESLPFIVRGFFVLNPHQPAPVDKCDYEAMATHTVKS